jgi:hypothetical protein
MLPAQIEKPRLVAITLGVADRFVPIKTDLQGGVPLGKVCLTGRRFRAPPRWPSRRQTSASSGSSTGVRLNDIMKSTALDAWADAVKMNLGSFSRAEIHDWT